jgi:hypothetical protein
MKTLLFWSSGQKRRLPTFICVFELEILIYTNEFVQFCQSAKRSHDRFVAIGELIVHKSDHSLGWPIYWLFRVALFPTRNRLHADTQQFRKVLLGKIQLVPEEPKLLPGQTPLVAHEHEADCTMETFPISDLSSLTTGGIDRIKPIQKENVVESALGIMVSRLP